MAIKPLEEVLLETINTIGKYQRGEFKQVKTNRPWLDHQGGVTPKNIITICAASFGGKSTELENLKDDIMNVEINSSASKYIWLSNSFEMTNFATTLRDIKKLTKKDFNSILNEQFSPDEVEILKKYRERRTDGRFFVNQVPQSAKEFICSVDAFLAGHLDKELVVLDLDHIGLIRASNDNKKLAVDDVIEGLNELKNKYNNFLVIILCQLNRGILTRLKEKSNESAVRRDDLFQSDVIYHTSDYVYALQNADYLKIEQYRKINPEKYPHLSHRFTESDSKGKVSLISSGCIFVEVLKDRTADIGFTDIFTIEIKPIEISKEPIKNIPTFSNTIPVFNDTPITPTAFNDLGKVFSKDGDGDSQSPF